MTSGALAGIRVIDFGQYVAGPLAALLLADQGAEVIRVDPPGGPRLRLPANAVWQRGKRSLILDLKQTADRETARRLIATADVVIENFRPGVMDRLGIGPEAMTAAHPRLIYCSLPGFASDHPRAGAAAWEGIVAAATDTYRPTPYGPPGQPVYTAIPISSNYAALLGAIAAAMALIARERDSLGQRIEVPLFDATFTAIGAFGLTVVDGPTGPGPKDLTGGGHFQTADGRWVNFSTFHPRHLEWFVDALGLTAWREEGVADPGRLARSPDRRSELRRRLRELFRTRTAQEWEDLVNGCGGPLAICRTTAEWIAHPHALASGAAVEVDDPDLGPTIQAGIPTRLVRTPGWVAGPRRPLNADRAAVLTELTAPLPRSPEPRTLNPAPSGPLAGVRVLDLSNVLAGPTAGRTLAEYGADVIKINSPREPGGDDPVLISRRHVDLNRGKRTLLLDLKTPGGQEVFRRLLDSADVVLQNARLGVADRLGVGYDQVHRRRPDIVYASVTAYGYTGPWGQRAGFETQAQATSGLEERFGGEGPPLLQPFAINDYATGLMGAFAVALALFHRARTGEGQAVETSLAHVATFHQTPFALAYEGKVWDEARGQQALGSGPLHRLYQAADGWFFLAGDPRNVDRLARIPELAGIEDVRLDALADFLADRLTRGTAAGWVDRLHAAGFGAQTLTPVRDLMEDPWVRDHGLSLTRDHGPLGVIRTVGPAARLSRTPVRAGDPARPPGADAPEILAEIGLAGEIDRLVGEGAVKLPSEGPVS